MYETKIAAAARVEAKLYADVVNNIENKNNVCKTAVMINENCGAFFLFNLPHEAGNALSLAINRVVSAGSIVHDNHEPMVEIITPKLIIIEAHFQTATSKLLPIAG